VTVQEQAKELRAVLQMLKAERNVLADRATEVLEAWNNSLYPITEIMREYNIPFRNTLIVGESERGFVVGEAVDADNDRPLLYVYDGLCVHLVDALTDERIDGPISTAKYINEANLEHVKAGFEYVRKLKETAVKGYLEQNNVLKRFVEESKEE